MSAPDIDDLIGDDPPFTLEDFQRQRAELVRRFKDEHCVREDEIDAVCEGHLHGTEIADDWYDLHALEPYVRPDDGESGY